VKCLRAVADIVPRAADHKQFDFKSKVGDNLREALAKEIHKRTGYHNGTLRTGLYDHVKQSGFYTPEQQQACTDDAFRLCSADVPDVDRVTACMVRNKSQLTPGCRVFFKPDPEPEISSAAAGRPLSIRPATSQKPASAKASKPKKPAKPGAS
jgi:hypothetical protein